MSNQFLSKSHCEEQKELRGKNEFTTTLALDTFNSPSVSVVTVIDMLGPSPILVDAATDILYSLNFTSPDSSIESVEPDVKFIITFPPLVT